MLDPETSILNMTMQVRSIDDPMVPGGFEKVRDTDVIKLLGTKEKTNVEAATFIKVGDK